jgi:D-lactate dehydrogenase
MVRKSDIGITKELREKSCSSFVVLLGFWGDCARFLLTGEEGRALDVMFYEAFDEEEKALRRYLPRWIKAGFTRQTIQEQRSKCVPASLISIRTQSIIPVAWAKSLKGILTRSTGYDHLHDYQIRSSQEISCGYLPLYCARSVAEHAILVMMALLRRLKRQMAQFKRFQRDGLTGGECLNRCLLVVGVGHIGQEIVKLARGMGMRVLGVDLVKKMPDLKYVTLKEGLRKADAVICALPLTELTRGMMGYARLNTARRGLIFVNVGRGEVSPVEDLARLFKKGLLGGIGLDVFEEEADLAGHLRSGKKVSNKKGKILLSLKDQAQVILTPHNAFNTAEALDRKAAQACDSILQFLKRGTFPHVVP